MGKVKTGFIGLLLFYGRRRYYLYVFTCNIYEKQNKNKNKKKKKKKKKKNVAQQCHWTTTEAFLYLANCLLMFVNVGEQSDFLC